MWLQVTAKTAELADFHMELMLNEAYQEAKAVMERNREVTPPARYGPEP